MSERRKHMDCTPVKCLLGHESPCVLFDPVSDDPEEEFAGAQLFCPVCCSQIDVFDAGLVQLECPSCETKFSVEVDPEIIASHAMVG